jgi:hypothetical protein
MAESVRAWSVALEASLRQRRQMFADFARLRHASLPPAVRASLPTLADAGLAAAPTVRALADEFAPLVLVEPPRPSLRRRLFYTLRVASEAAREHAALWLAPWLGDEQD